MGDLNEKILVNEDWKSLILFFSFFIITFLKSLDPNKFKYLINFLNVIMFFKIFDKEKRSFFNIFFFLGIFLTFIIFSLSVFFILEELDLIQNSLESFNKIFISISLISITRTLILYLSSKILGINELINKIIYKNITFLIQLSFLLYVLILFSKYGFNSNNYFLFFSILITYILLVISQIWVYWFHYNKIKNNVLFLILYICAFKVSPWIIAYSIITDLRY